MIKISVIFSLSRGFIVGKCTCLTEIPSSDNIRAACTTSYVIVPVIVPVYNVEEYIRTCVDSLVGQSYQNLEIVLVDDGSTDASDDCACHMQGYITPESSPILILLSMFNWFSRF